MKRSRGKTIELWFWAIASTGAALWVCTAVLAIIVEWPHKHKMDPGLPLALIIAIAATWLGFKMFLSVKNSN